MLRSGGGHCWWWWWCIPIENGQGNRIGHARREGWQCYGNGVGNMRGHGGMTIVVQPVETKQQRRHRRRPTAPSCCCPPKGFKDSGGYTCRTNKIKCAQASRVAPNRSFHFNSSSRFVNVNGGRQEEERPVEAMDPCGYIPNAFFAPGLPGTGLQQ